MMFEAIEIITKLFSGQGRQAPRRAFHAREREALHPAREPLPVYVATAGPVNAKRTGRLADGMITVGAADDKIKMLWGKFEEGAREAGKDPAGMPKLLQVHVSWAPTDQEAIENAMREWPNGGMPFPEAGHQEPRGLRGDGQARPTRGLHEPPADRRRPCPRTLAYLQRYVDMGFDEIHIHNVGRNQAEFIDVFGREVLPEAPARLIRDRSLDRRCATATGFWLPCVGSTTLGMGCWPSAG